MGLRGEWDVLDIEGEVAYRLICLLILVSLRGGSCSLFHSVSWKGRQEDRWLNYTKLTPVCEQISLVLIQNSSNQYEGQVQPFS